ncbi:amidohydrolase family protein (plasmid) [Embleya sp. NBC_00888]|uniref:amidohydrolase family protein n=1 Tax=Embleya sp. NBC_00888 TaxID=2975960 RepID=UPI002F90B064|nr:amidohydrolase family protein [Embleya sp. NBC_00888]
MGYRVFDAAGAAELSIPVIDCHHHVGNIEPDEWMQPEWRQQDQADRQDFMAANDIDRCVIMPMPLMTLTHDNQRYATAHDVLARYRDERPDLVAAACATVNPAEPQSAEAELVRCFDELDFRGVSYHHRYLGLTVNDERMSVVLETARAFDRAVLVHILAESSDMESPWRLFALARRYPDVRFLALDGFSSPQQAAQLVEVAGDFPNVWFDTGVATAVAHGFAHFVERWGPDRLVLGTDHYSGPRNFYTAFPVREMHAIGFAPDVLARIAYRNAGELLGLDFDGST